MATNLNPENNLPKHLWDYGNDICHPIYPICPKYEGCDNDSDDWLVPPILAIGIAVPLIILFGWNLIARYPDLLRIQLRVEEQELQNRIEGIELIEGTRRIVTNGNVPSPVAGLPRVGIQGLLDL